MTKVKNYIIGGLFVLLLIASAQVYFKTNQITELSSEVERLELNIQNLIAENKQQTNLILTQEEWLVLSADSIQKLLRTLAIKPKQVIKYIEREIKEVIRDTIEVESEWLKDVTWGLSDGDECWQWKAEATLQDLDLNVNRTFFEYNNSSTDIYYWQRKKILFFRIGKKEFFQKQIPKCGTESVREITIVKK